MWHSWESFIRWAKNIRSEDERRVWELTLPFVPQAVVKAGNRLYVSGGCQENVLQNTEINSRATLYLNLLQVLNVGLYPEKWAFFTDRDQFQLLWGRVA